MAGKIIEILVLLAGLLITAAIVVYIPFKSYTEHKDYLAKMEQQMQENAQAAIKPKLESLTVELKEGVVYYANDLADAKVEHFTVVANYVKGEEKYSEEVESDKFTISTPDDFYAHGGDITITFKGVSAKVTVELVPVVIESIEIVSNPYIVKYAEGSTFDASGMIVKAVYNDGSSKVLSAEDYTVDTTKVLSVADKDVVVSYTIGETTKTAKVAISVTATLDDGAVQSIVIVDKAIVNAGDVVANATLEVNAIYESGNRKPLDASEYTIQGSAEATKFGKSYGIVVVYNADTTKTAMTEVIVRQTLQGEDGVIVGGKSNAETEYVVVDGAITATDHNVSFAGNFSKSILEGKEGSLTLTINSATKTIGNITMRCGNSYLVGASGNYQMQPLQINTILDLTINGREVQIPASVVLKGCGPWESYAPLYGIYYEFTFENIELDPGENVVKFNFKKSTVGALNCWGESPSTMNIDYVTFDTLGNEIPDDYTIAGLKISESFKPEYKQDFAGLHVPAVAVLDNGTEIGIDPALYNVKVTGQKEGDTYFRFGTYTIEISLKSNPEVKASVEYEIPVHQSFVVLNAYVELVDGKPYYVLSGTSTGYVAEDLLLFDGVTKYPFTVTFGEDTFVMKVDLSEYREGNVIWPHISMAGVNYVNGANNAGDVRGNGLVFENGQSVTYNGLVFSIKEQYSMPTLVVTAIPDFKAVKNNSFSSSKNLLAEMKWGSEGVTVVGGNKSKDAEYINGIGGLDKANRSVTYTFTVAEDGKVDFIWNVAGNQWKSGGTNLGITDMSAHMTVTLDGKTVDVSGIELPAGVGTDADVWWNLQQIVLKDVELTAGEHTFSCVITTDGAGLNVGAMEIYYAAN